MLIRSMDGRITLWSPAMKQRYGFTSDQARAQIAHQLLRTIFWKPLHEVEGALLEQKAWSGGLIHHRLDGRPVVTAAYWHLHLDVTGGEPVVVELHSDIVPVGDSVSNQLADVMAILALRVQSASDRDIELRQCNTSLAAIGPAAAERSAVRGGSGD